MKTMRWITWRQIAKGSALIALLVIPAVSRADDAPGAISALTQLEPITLLRDGTISGCGIKAQAASAGHDARFALTLFRDSATATGTRLVLSASWQNQSNVPLRLSELRFTTTQDLIVPNSPPRQAASGDYEHLVDPEADSGANAVRQAMLTGATVTLTTGTGAIFKITTEAPASGSVRAAYLNCAGDLFRPEP